MLDGGPRRRRKRSPDLVTCPWRDVVQDDLLQGPLSHPLGGPCPSYNRPELGELGRAAVGSTSGRCRDGEGAPSFALSPLTFGLGGDLPHSRHKGCRRGRFRLSILPPPSPREMTTTAPAISLYARSGVGVHAGSLSLRTPARVSLSYMLYICTYQSSQPEDEDESVCI